MLTVENLLQGQQKYGSVMTSKAAERLSYSLYLTYCRKMLSDRARVTAGYFDWDKRAQDDFSNTALLNFVLNDMRDVEGYVNADGERMLNELAEALRRDIIDFGVLRRALDDDDIQEIQINDYKTIWVVKGGRSELYVDASGKPYQFVDDLELRSTIDRMIYNPNGNTARMTEINPLLNARTSAKGYRVSAVNRSAITRDITAGMNFDVTSVTIRKYAPSRLTFDDFAKYGTLTRKMAEFLRLCGRADVRLACVGQTSSGKTTLLNAVVWEIPKDQRLILIQNPTELMLYERSPETGTNLRNVLHWEASDVALEHAKDPTTPTMGNFMAHTLRNTPDVVIPGEVRTPEEFFQMYRILKTGHRVLTTFHAGGGQDAVERAATELAALGGSIDDYKRTLVHSFDIIVSQQKLGDGSRRVMAIEELTGKIDDYGRAETKLLFEYELTGEVEKDSYGKILHIGGEFKQKAVISSRLKTKFFAVGISKEELSPFLEINGAEFADSAEETDYAYTHEKADGIDVAAVLEETGAGTQALTDDLGDIADFLKT